MFTRFRNSIEGIQLPEKFTFPFYYEVHPLCRRAAEELQQNLLETPDFKHNFGLTPEQEGLVIGKMFGVLVVRNQADEIGYLAAFSGKLAESNYHNGFVPPVYDTLQKEGFYKSEEELLNGYNEQIRLLEESETLSALKQKLHAIQYQAREELAALQTLIRENKVQRKTIRENLSENMSSEERTALFEQLIQESLKEQYTLKDQKREWRLREELVLKKLNSFLQEIQEIKEERANRSALLQRRLFEQYCFLNRAGEKKSLLTIFETQEGITPPAGAGECAAPKLLQYAFLNNFEPIALAEFWWGAPPKSSVRKHQQFYPSCKSKCEPILNHMLDGMLVDDNPLIVAPSLEKDIEIVFEDDYLFLVNKPHEFLSVPGKTISDSVVTRMKEKYGGSEGPFIVHRLDMSTSGLLLFAKTMPVYHHLQRQFIGRKVKKSYVAMLDGVLEQTEGFIDLPLRVDLDDRPRQLVCYEYGKPAQTHWQLIAIEEGRSRVSFTPLSGRTHQLRVHAAHPLGLNLPICGDDLYGTKADRLYLHAAYLSFVHPISGQQLEFSLPSSF